MSSLNAVPQSSELLDDRHLDATDFALIGLFAEQSRFAARSADLSAIDQSFVQQVMGEIDNSEANRQENPSLPTVSLADRLMGQAVYDGEIDAGRAAGWAEHVRQDDHVRNWERSFALARSRSMGHANFAAGLSDSAEEMVERIMYALPQVAPRKTFTLPVAVLVPVTVLASVCAMLIQTLLSPQGLSFLSAALMLGNIIFLTLVVMVLLKAVRRLYLDNLEAAVHARMQGLWAVRIRLQTAMIFFALGMAWPMLSFIF